MQINTTISYHLKPVRMATMKKTSDNICGCGWGEKESLVHLLAGQ